MSSSRGDGEMLKVEGVTKRLGQKDILKDVNLSLARKSVTGLVGANGAGKTTLIKCLTGVYRPEQGRVTIDGRDVHLDAQVRARIGYVADQSGLFLHYTADQMVSFYAGIYADFDRKRFAELNDTFGLRTSLAARALSKGQRTILALMLNLSIRPDYLLLDEPASGLDPLIKRDLFRMLLAEVEERDLGVLISSHNLDDLERFCDQIAFISQGRLLQAGSVEEMKSSLHKLQVVFEREIPSDLAKWEGIVSVERVGKLVTIVGAGELEILKAKLQAAGALRAEPMEMTLEEMIIQRMKGEKRSC
ncbi:MAG: ABC transporter ATP-binding protein [Bacillota bacterium]